MEVRLLAYTPNPDKVVYVAGRLAYSNKKVEKLIKEAEDEQKVARFLDMLWQRGHLSVYEHASFTFLIEGCSRVCTHQLVRHRLASYTQQSQRYAGVKHHYALPPTIVENNEVHSLLEQVEVLYNRLVEAGVPEEDARYIVPQAVKSRIVVTMNARELLHFFELRTCMHAQLEIRKVAWQMLMLVQEVAPNLFKHAGPSCMTRHVCPENDVRCPMYERYILNGR